MNRLRNRVHVKLRLLEIATYALTDVELYDERTVTIPVRWTWDGVTQPTDTAMYLGQITASNLAGGISQQSTQRDQFEIACQLYIADSPDGIFAELATEAALNALDGAVRATQCLVSKPADLIPSEYPISAWQVSSVILGDSVGPYHTWPQPRGSKATPGVVDFSYQFTTALR